MNRRLFMNGILGGSVAASAAVARIDPPRPVDHSAPPQNGGCQGDWEGWGILWTGWKQAQDSYFVTGQSFPLGIINDLGDTEWLRDALIKS